MTARRFIVMGVSGCGKTSVGMGFAARIGGRFIDGDDLHPASNIAKMARGEPLDDGDREPWLAQVAARFLQEDDVVVIGCSALRRKYRDWLRAGVGGDIVFLHLSGSRRIITERMQARKDHFMPPSLIDSQFAALELPQADETSITVDIDNAMATVVSELVRQTEGMRV